MAILSTFLKVCSGFAMVTGTMDLLFGVSMLEGPTGDKFLVNSNSTIFADSQLRFLGSIWLGYGLMLWWTSNDLKTRKQPLSILGIIMILGGIGRIISGLQHGFIDGLMLQSFIAIELFIPPLVWLLGDWR